LDVTAESEDVPAIQKLNDGPFGSKVQEIVRPSTAEVIEPLLVDSIVAAHRQFINADNQSVVTLRRVIKQEYEVEKTFRRFCGQSSFHQTVSLDSSAVIHTLPDTDLNAGNTTTELSIPVEASLQGGKWGAASEPGSTQDLPKSNFATETLMTTTVVGLLALGVGVLIGRLAKFYQ
jgi:hypothetical protein